MNEPIGAELILLAASGLAREVLSADIGDLRVVGILDDDELLQGKSIGGVEVLGGISLAATRTEALLICVGPSLGRQRVAKRLAAAGVGDERFATVIDGSVRVPPNCVIGVGSIVLANVVLTADVVVGRHVVIMPQSTLTHDVVLGDFATLAAGVSIGGSVQIGEAAYLGMNSSVRQSLTIGARSTVGMSAAVLSDIPSGQTWVGVPARPIVGRLADAVNGTDYRGTSA